MRATDLAAAAGLTYRQLDWWVRRGLVTCQQAKPPAPRKRGHGFPREFTEEEARVVIDAGQLVTAGVAPAAAITLARAIHAHGRARLGPYTVTTPQRQETP